MSDLRKIVPGISINKSGQATIDTSLADVLFELAIKLDDSSRHPVDIEHVVAAIVLAADNGSLESTRELSDSDENLISVLAKHVEIVFQEFGGEVGIDD